MDRLRRWFGLFIVLIVAGAVMLVVTVRPGLRNNAESVDRSWTPLVQPLDVRYRALDAVIAQLKANGAENRSATIGLIQLSERWRVIRSGTDSADQVRTANRLEALAARAKALATSARLADVAPLRAALSQFVRSRPSPAILDGYNAHADSYQSRRDGFWGRIVAALDSYPMRPTLQLMS